RLGIWLVRGLIQGLPLAANALVWTTFYAGLVRRSGRALGADLPPASSPAHPARRAALLGGVALLGVLGCNLLPADFSLGAQLHSVADAPTPSPAIPPSATPIPEIAFRDVPTTQDEVHVQHILVADEALAKQIKDQLDKGADFAALAAQYSTDTSNKDKGGDLGWFAPTAKGGPMVQEFSDAAFALTKPGQISAPVKSQFGWHIIRLIERGPQPLSQTDLDKAKSIAFDNWLKKEKD
ncbi:MAG TPA: peptidylprolyl isomerase, partial [Chloroflexia bacterium]|nr:peptidylprolyl isomerase [Chloroflexia bacterium]